MSRKDHRERGVALILAILALVLLSAIGIGMLVSADSETMIAANYRDKQVALYAAQSGLQEGRDRLKNDDYFNPTAGTPVPTKLPGPGADLANIVYILNPAAGETIEPWREPTSTNPNPYYDTDICNKLPAICTGTPPHPPSSGGYTSVGHNTAYATAGPQTSFKWVRIMLKADNMAPVKVKVGAAAPTGAQVCYDPTSFTQFPLTGSYSIYSAKCMPVQGRITEVTLAAGNSGGSNYSATPTVTIDPPATGGTTATATAQTSLDTGNEHLTSIAVLNGGTGYKTPPIVTIDPPPNLLSGGIQATASATIVAGGSSVQSASATNGSPAGCYSFSNSPTITASGGGGTGATFAASMTGQTCVLNFSVSGSCSAAKRKTVPATMAGGVTANVTFDKNGNWSGTSITNPGTGVSTPPSSISVSGCTGVTPTSVQLGYQVDTSKPITVLNGGSNYTTAPSLQFQAPSKGSTPTGTTVLGPPTPGVGTVKSITITNQGSGYVGATVNVTLSSADGFGSGATAIGSLAPSRKISGFTVTNSGSGYTYNPNVTITDATGSGADAIARVDDVHMGQVYLVTALARAPGGSVAMAEMETARAYFKINLATGGLILGGPHPSFSPPNSSPMTISGRDTNSCGDPTTMPNKPAIGVYDDPYNVTSPTAVDSVSADLTGPGVKTGNFVGVSNSGDVQNIYDNLGPPDVAAQYLNDVVSAVNNETKPYPACTTWCNYSSNPGSINLGTAANPAVNVVNGDLSMTGNVGGYGVLIVTGTLTLGGNFSWHGPILVIGDGNVVFSGGGNGQIVGTVFVANTRGGSGSLKELDDPNATWSGGGGNGIQYDHCWADNQIKKLNLNPPVLPGLMKVLSIRTVGTV